MKGQIALIEAILASVVLFIAFNILITAESYQTKWNDATTLLQGRDILITVDRLGELHNYAFSQNTFENEFLDKIDVIKDAIKKVDTQGTVKDTTYIACDCTNEQVTYLQDILSDVKFNDREINVDICSTTLPSINPCTTTQQYPDILIIWNYKDLTSYIDALLSFVNNGNGIIEIADMQAAQIDNAQQTIFGLKWIDEGDFPSNQDEFLKPRNASVLTYQSYKWFYHLPYTLTGTTTNSIPLDGGGETCTSPDTATAGIFRFQNIDHKIWICNGNTVWFDSGGADDGADFSKIQGETFILFNNNFFLNYIDSADKIRVSFKPDYRFDDFLVKDNSYNKLLPIDDDKNKVLISMGYWDLLKEKPISVAIFSGTENAKTIWLPDFSRTGLFDTEDDHKQLLASLILSISNKKIKDTSLTIGQITSYINAVNKDMFEVYNVDLGIGAPF